MKSLRATVLGLTMILAAGLGYSHSADVGTDKTLLRLQLLTDKSVEKTVAELGLDVAGIDLHERILDVVVTPDDLQRLKKYAHIRILQSYAAQQVAAPDHEYMTSQEVTEALTKFAADYPTLTMLMSIGKTNDGKDIWAMKISDNPTERENDEPVILFNAMHHAREVMTTEVAIDTIEYLLTRYEVDFAVADWVNNTEIWVVPMLNVDGNDKVWNSDTMWRKNTRGGYGVDINRNYPYAWNSCNGSSGSRNSDTYRGDGPGSEPETQALMNLVAAIQPVFNISYHSYSELVIYPYGCRGQRAGNREIVEGIGHEIANLLPSDSNSSRKYAAGTAWELLYSVDGGDIDWMHNAHQVIPYVIELNASAQGFQPRYATWRDRTVEKLRAAWMFLLDRVQASGIRGVIEDATDTDSTILITAISDNHFHPFAATHKLKPDGSFHIILEPGMYNVRIDVPGKASLEKLVTVGATRIDLGSLSL